MFRNEAECTANGIDNDGNGYVDDCYGIDTFNHDSNPMDDYGHGTHVAGTIGAVGNNGIGVTGVAWQVKLAACKFIGADGWGYDSGAIECVDYFAWLKDHGVNIVATSNSWGGGDFSQALIDAIDGQRDRNILLVAAAGNNGNSFAEQLPMYPAGYDRPNIISVAATDNRDKLAIFSSRGRLWVDLGAPGVDVLSTVPGNSYASYSGTSMATPHVTGVVALLKAQDPSRDWKALKNLVLVGGNDNPDLAGTTLSGRRLNAYGSLTCTDRVLRSRLRPTGPAITVAPNTNVPLVFLSLNCTAAAGPVQVNVTETGQVLDLRDDGVAPDTTAGDGTFAGAFTTTQTIGVYTLNFPGGDALVVSVEPGYSYQVTDYNYRNIAGTNLNPTDDSFATIALPFSIQFGYAPRNTLYVADNGLVSFDASITAFEHRPGDLTDELKNQPQPAPIAESIVAPFWDDLYPAPGNVFYQAIGNAPNRELVIEWRDMSGYYCYSDEAAKFQVVFSEATSDVLFNYADVYFSELCDDYDIGSYNYGSSATVGIQLHRELATQYSFNSPSLSNGLALLWRMSGDNPVPAISALTPEKAPAGGGDFTLNVDGTGFVFGSEVLWNGVPKPTTRVDSAHLAATISNADIAAPGSAQVTVRNLAPGGGESNTLPFTIGPPASITVTSPNGGENWQPDTTHTISWAYTGDPGTTVRIDLVGPYPVEAWLPTSAPIGGNGFGTFSWRIPYFVEPGDYRVRITSNAYPGISDSSDADLRVGEGSVTLVSPNGGETWAVGSTQTISWTYSGNLGLPMAIYLGRDFGQETQIVYGVPMGTNGSGSYSWKVTGVPRGSDYRIRLFACCYDGYGTPGPGDSSDAPFTILGDTSITVTSPNGGEVWTNGSPQTVSWTYTGSPGLLIINLIDEKFGGITSSDVIPAGSNGSGSYQWNIWPLRAGTHYRIHVGVNSNSLVHDVSDAEFSIRPAPIMLTSPNGGEVWTAGTTRSITWTYTGSPGNVKIELLKNGVLSSTISASAPVGSSGSGSFSWLIPSTTALGDDYRVRLTSLSNPSVTYTSSGDFRINRDGIVLKTPNGGESWGVGSTQQISWIWSGSAAETVKVELYKGGVLNRTIDIVTGQGGIGWDNWAIPSTQALGSDYKIKVTSLTNPTYTDQSDANFGIQLAGPVAPTAVSVTPSSGTGTTQTFSFLFSDGGGASKISYVQALINGSLSWYHSCAVLYYLSTNRLYLVNDAGNGWQGPLTPGQAGTLQNGQCTLDGGASSASAVGNNLTVNAALTFKGAFAGNKTLYLDAEDTVNKLSSGWQNLGTWTVPVSGPKAVSVTPSSGSGTSQAFSFLFSDAGGASKITYVQALINGSLAWQNSCAVLYYQSTNRLYLVLDSGAGWQGPLTPGQAGTLQNSQCTLNGGASSVSAVGNNLTVNAALTFKPAFTGNKTVYLDAEDTPGKLSSGFKTLGSWTVPNFAPTAVSVTPSSGTGSTQIFSFLFSDTGGANKITYVQALINGSLSWYHSCAVLYYQSTNRLYLVNDAGNGWQGPLTPGQAGTLQNGQCTLNGAGSSVSAVGNNLTVNAALTFKPGFGGTKTVYLDAEDTASHLSSGWQNRGTWTVPASAPTAVSVTPSSGTGSSQTFALLYSDADGVGKLTYVQALINGSLAWPNSCAVLYYQSTNRLYLVLDSGTGWQGSLTPGQAGTLSNSQCTLDGGASSVSAVGNNLTVNAALTFKAAFTGGKTVYLDAEDVPNKLSSGWQTLGTWTVP
jgi:hypothetical protein